MTRLLHPILIAAVVLGGLTALWLLLGAPITLVTQIAIYTLYGAAVNVLVAYTGLVPFGASVFFGCASYAAAFFLLHVHVGPGFDLLALLVAVVFSAVLALVIGLIILRHRGLYFSLLTLAFSQIAFEIAFTAKAIDLDMHPFQLHSFIGPNGAGKTTFFNMLTGVLPADAGVVMLEGRDITRLKMYQRAQLGIGRSFQILSVFPNLSAFENVRIAVQARRGRARGLFWDAYRNDLVNVRAWSLLDAVGLAGHAATRCADMPHGAKRLLEIAITLATDARVLLLDEPLAGLAEADRQIVSALIRKLADTHAVLLIEHDIDRVLKLSDRITVLHQGRLIADGAPHEIAGNPDVVAYEGSARVLEADHALQARLLGVVHAEDLPVTELAS